MKNNFKNILYNFNFIKSHIRNKRLRAYSLSSRLFPGKQYSDFFIYCCDAYKNSFVAENMLSLLSKQKINITHSFDFYSKNGDFISNYKFEDSNFYAKINLPIIKNKNSKYLSFTHKLLLKDKQPSFEMFNYDFSMNHRGYTIVYKDQNSLGTIVHGNFGAIDVSNNIQSRAKIRNNLFIYTIAYKFEKFYEYEIIFNNPCNKKLNVEIIKNSTKETLKEESFSMKINQYGNQSYLLKDYSGTISIESKMPICRPLIIKDPYIESGNFDMFHS